MYNLSCCYCNKQFSYNSQIPIWIDKRNEQHHFCSELCKDEFVEAMKSDDVKLKVKVKCALFDY